MRKSFATNLSRTLILSIVFAFFYNCGGDDSTGPSVPIDDTVNNTVTLQIYFTNDEHGWLEPTATHNGAAGMMAMWKTDHGYTQDGINLVLSGGDMWTGPAISTWYEGEPMVEVMNAMGYDAAAIGNHEFDFSQDGLRARLNQADFPFLAANLKKIGGGYPDFVEPYIIKNIGGIKVGIIGLTTNSTISINFPLNVEGLELISYQAAIDEAAPLAIVDGAEILILNTHIPSAEMQGLVSYALGYGISVFGCGHSHNLTLNTQPDYVLFETESNMTRYAFTEIKYDTLENRILNLSASLHENTGSYQPDPEIQSIVTTWQSAMSDDLSEVLGYTSSGVNQNSREMQNMISDSWLEYFSDADISMSNYGGVRQGIPSGDITIATIVGVLPFDNNVVKLDLTGAQTKNAIASLGVFVGGVNVINNYTMNDGSTMDDNATYTVLITDYIYYTNGDLQMYDPTPEATGVNWRNPVINWIRSLNTNQADPLENYLDSIPRKTTPSVIFYL